MAADLPSAIGPYRIVRTISRKALTWVAEVERDGRTLVLKTLLQHSAASQETQKRFRREVQAAMAVQHPNVARVVDCGAWDGTTPYLVFEQIRGITLDDFLSAHAPLPWSRTRHLLVQLLSGLQAIHEAGLIHRQLTPDNVLIGADDHVALLDFGLVRPASGHALTDTGVALGSLQFIAPEQAADAKHVDARADLYVAGLLGFHLLTGRSPFPDVRLDAACPR